MRLFFILVLLQMLFLPTHSAFPGDLDPYEWERQKPDVFYRGTLVLPDGTKQRFQTRENRLLFPRGSKVAVTAYAARARPVGQRKVARMKVARKTSAPQHAREDDLDHASYGSVEAIVGPVEVEKEERSPSGQGMTSDLCESISGKVSFYLGQETILAQGGLSEYKGRSGMGGTLADWACRLSENWAWSVRLGRHDLNLKQVETTSTGPSERMRTYDRTFAMIAGIFRSGFWEYGAGLSYTRLPFLKISKAEDNASQLDQQGFAAVDLMGRYAPESGLQAGISLSPFALGAKSYLSYGAEVGWHTPFGKSWHWELGLHQEGANFTLPNACRDNPACRKNATSQLQQSRGWLGVGKDF